MGWFGRFFGSGPRTPPAWATGFANAPERFAAFADDVVEALVERGFPALADDVRSGSVMLTVDGEQREWMVHEAAERCAVAEPAAWPRIIRASLAETAGDGHDDAGDVIDDDDGDDASAPRDHGGAPLLEAARLRAPGERAQQVLAHMMAGQLVEADTVAAEAIAAGEDVEDLRYQRAMIALMRGYEDAALRELELLPDLATATNSRAVILARRGDPRAKELAVVAVAKLPGDAIAIRTAVLVHLLLADRDGARAVLAAQAAHLAPDLRAALERAIDEPPQVGAHRFPEHAALLVEAVKPMIDAGNYAQVEPLLQRAAGWDPENVAVTTELGFVLARLGRDDDAIRIYDPAIERGGAGVLLHFNRGNCQLRRGQYAAAAADFAACVALKADWHDARVNLVSALFATGDRAGARAELDRLRDLGGRADHVRSLEQMLGGTL